MKRILIALLGVTNVALALPSVLGGKDTATHKFVCGNDSTENVDCNAECKGNGGWTGKAVISNTHEFRGVRCLCKNTESTQISANEGETTYIEQQVHAVISKSTPFTTKSKCWASGWNGATQVVGSPAVSVPKGRQYCITPGTQTLKAPNDACEYNPATGN